MDGKIRIKMGKIFYKTLNKFYLLWMLMLWVNIWHDLPGKLTEWCFFKNIRKCAKLP
jgi:hypothetical protein